MVGISSGIMMSAVIACGAGAASVEAPGPEHPGTAEAPAAPASTAGPSPAEAPRSVPEVRLRGRDGARVPVRVQVAISESDRQRGLMFRRQLDSDAGMLFVFEEMQHLSFWMENTFIPLDVVFIDDRGLVVGIVSDTIPLSQDAIEVDGDSQFVLEVNAGFVREHGIEAGSQVELIGVSLPAGAP